MRIVYTRKHKVRPAEYEALDFGVSLDIDTDADEEYHDMSLDNIHGDMVRAVDEFLAEDVDRAVRLGGTMNDSHLWEYYDIEEK